MASVHQKYVLDNLVWYTAHRWYDALGGDVVKYIEKFVSTPFASANNMANCTTTLVNLSTVALAAEGRGLLITTAGAENDGANIQLVGEAFKLDTTSRPTYFAAKFQLSEVTQSDFLVGLCITDTDLLGGFTDGICFRKVDGSTTLNFVLNKNSTETVTAYGTALVAATDYIVEFFFDGSSVDWYVNGVLQTRPVMTNFPNDEYLTPSVQFLTGDANPHTALVGELKAIEIFG